MSIPKNMLFSLNGIDFAASYGKLQNAMRFYNAGAKTMAHWGGTEGGGRFTVKVSKYFIFQLRQWMIGTGGTKLALPSTSYHSKYLKFKRRFGFAQTPWMLFGNVFKHVGVIWRGKHGRTIGIRRNVKVPRIGITGKPYGQISVAKYAAINEFGGKFHPARPLFMPAMLKFVGHHFPPMVKTVEKAIYKAAKEEAKDLSVKSEGIGSVSDTVSSASLRGIEKVASSNPDADFKYHANELYAAGGGTEMTKSEIGKSSDLGVGMSRSMIKKSENELDAWLKSQGMTAADLEGDL